MLFTERTKSNTLAVAVSLFSLVSISDARFRRAAQSSTPLSATAAITSSTTTTPTLPAATTTPTTPTNSTTMATSPPISASSSSGNASPTAPPLSPGHVSIRSNCTYDVFYMPWSLEDTSNFWLPLPRDGLVFNFADSPRFDDAALQVKYGFSKYQDNGGSANVIQLGVTWLPGIQEVNYDFYMQIDPGTSASPSPFEADGYSVVPTPILVQGSANCNTLSCKAGENPCMDSYQNGEIPNTSDSSRPWGQKTNVCPETTNLTFVLCTHDHS